MPLSALPNKSESGNRHGVGFVRGSAGLSESLSPASRRQFVRFGLAAGAGLSALGSFGPGGPASGFGSAAWAGSKKREKAVAFSLRAVRGAAYRGSFDLAKHLGKRPVLVTFFATWCRPCEVELPFLQKLTTEHPKDAFAVVAVSIDGPDSAARIAPMTQRLGVKFPVVHDADSRVTARYNPRRFAPYLVSIDKQGFIAGKKEGWTPAHGKKLKAHLASLLKA